MEKSTKPIDDQTVFEVKHESTPSVKSSLHGDRLNFSLLISLYIIQGIPVGLFGSISMILQASGMMTYRDQALFSIVLWPHSIKLLWAPIVDAIFLRRIGRRKCWLIPILILTGIVLVYMANNIDEWLKLFELRKSNITMMASVILVLNILSSTQNIVVDGWSLTMLKKENVCYASTCVHVGILTGMFIGSVCFTLLVSEKFNNTFLGSVPGSGGLITMKSFLYFWAILVFSITTYVGIFKRENDCLKDSQYEKVSVFQNYKLLWDILKLLHMRVLIIAILTAKVGFVATDAVSHLKLIDAGVTTDTIMIITIVITVLQLFLPIFIVKHIRGPKPMNCYLKIMPMKLFWGIIFALLVYFTPNFVHTNNVNDVSLYYYVTLGSVMIINEMLSSVMILVLFAFFYQISDPRFGGTYMTLFNTLFLFGWLIPYSLVLKFVDIITRNIIKSQKQFNVLDIKDEHREIGSDYQHIFNVDGYYIAVCMCTILGCVWYGVFKNSMKKYQSLNSSCWMVNLKQSIDEEVQEPCVTSSAV